jgi:hypothetical protein
MLVRGPVAGTREAVRPGVVLWAPSGTPRALDWPTASFSDRIVWRPCADHGRKHDTGDVVLRCENGEPAGLVLLDEEVVNGADGCVSAKRLALEPCACGAPQRSCGA